MSEDSRVRLTVGNQGNFSQPIQESKPKERKIGALFSRVISLFKGNSTVRKAGGAKSRILQEANRDDPAGAGINVQGALKGVRGREGIPVSKPGGKARVQPKLQAPAHPASYQVFKQLYRLTGNFFENPRYPLQIQLRQILNECMQHCMSQGKRGKELKRETLDLFCVRLANLNAQKTVSIEVMTGIIQDASDYIK